MSYANEHSHSSQSLVAEDRSPYTSQHFDVFDSIKSGYSDELPRRIEVANKPGEEVMLTYFILSENELRAFLAAARQCKASAKLVADSLLRLGPDMVTEANAAYGLERQMAELQEKVRLLID